MQSLKLAENEHETTLQNDFTAFFLFFLTQDVNTVVL